MTIYYFSFPNLWVLLACLGVGWLGVWVGSFRWGWRFALPALVLGLSIPVGWLVVVVGSGAVLLDWETLALNAAYWSIPASVLAAVALLIRRLRPA